MDNIPTTLLLADREVPHFAQWLGLWHIEPNALNSLVSTVSSLDLRSHLASVQARSLASGQRPSNRIDSRGVATIMLEGALQKHASSIGGGNNSTVLARRAIRDANQDETVGAILLYISSPGGTSAGTKELFDDVAASKKPVIAFCDDLCASAAYWVASASTKIIANESALVGSIGTYAVVQDFSARAEQEGIKVTVVKAGDFKGMGIAGTEVTEEQMAEIQRMVDSRNEFFLDGVAKGRTMPKAEVLSLADGRIHSASDAVKMRLIDSVGTFDSAFDEAHTLAEQYLTKPKPGKKSMDVKELRSACPGASAAFILKCLESGMTVAEAANGWAQEMAIELAAANESNAALTAEVASLKSEVATLTAKLEAPVTLPKSTIGVAPLAAPAAKTEGESAQSEYWSKVNEYTTSGKTRREAMLSVNKQHPQLRAALVNEANGR